MQTRKPGVGSSLKAVFRDPICLFGIVSVLLLVVLAIAPAKDYFAAACPKSFLRLRQALWM